MERVVVEGLAGRGRGRALALHLVLHLVLRSPPGPEAGGFLVALLAEKEDAGPGPGGEEL